MCSIIDVLCVLLIINGDKTHLVVMGSKKTAVRRQEVSIQADGHSIYPSKSEKLLGGIICEDMKWKEHLVRNEQSLVRQVASRLNAVILVSKRASRGTRLMVANGIFMSKLCYLIPLWGSCEQYLVKSLQILQNKAARAVTGKSWFTPVRTLLQDCKWLSVNQLIHYHTVLQVHKVLISQKPVYFHQKLSAAHPYNTRQVAGGSIWRGEESGGGGFCSRGSQAYNSLPTLIRKCKTLPTFKKKLKIWISANIPL